MKVDLFLSKLEKAKATGRGTWLACCPAHNDEHPSMTVRELDDGRVLVHCFTGCEVEQILDAVGLKFDALFPDEPQEYAKPLRRPFPAADVLEAIEFELKVIELVADDMARGENPSEVDRARMKLAAERIREARRLALGKRR
jgi:hypothetical protein